ncbi:MAG: hypothetical protein NZ912_03145 [Ignisphaera sp.]|nr:hypothetical protein [Ignisphaera sp.]
MHYSAPDTPRLWFEKRFSGCCNKVDALHDGFREHTASYYSDMWWVKLKVSEFIVEVPVYKGVPLVLGEVDAFSSLGLGLALKVRIDKLLLKVEEPLGISRASSV